MRALRRQGCGEARLDPSSFLRPIVATSDGPSSGPTLSAVPPHSDPSAAPRPGPRFRADERTRHAIG